MGVSENTPMEEVKQKYRARAQMLHPDKITDPALRKEAQSAMQELNHAWETIKLLAAKPGASTIGFEEPTRESYDDTATHQQRDSVNFQSEATQTNVDYDRPIPRWLHVVAIVLLYVLIVAVVGSVVEAIGANQAKAPLAAATVTYFAWRFGFVPIAKAVQRKNS